MERVDKCGVLTTLFVPWMGEKLDGVTNRPYVISSCDNFLLLFGWGECSSLSLQAPFLQWILTICFK
jgi:hypothetical protein